MSNNEPFRIIYDRSRFPKQQRRADGSLGCRGCGGPIPKGRKSWCSRECWNKYEPSRVCYAVRQRDKDICCECGVDCQKAYNLWQAEKGKPGWNWTEWHKSEPPGPEYDHIIPFSEGGLTVLENMRTLCSACHKKRTRHWHGQRKQKPLNQPELIPLTPKKSS